MSEEIEKKIEFIVEQQAQFAVDIQILRETQAEDARLVKDSLMATITLIGKLVEAQDRTDKRVAEIAEGVARTDANVSELAERLNIFINVVEKYISRNRGSEEHQVSSSF